jgi:nucleoside-diphosphate-sugar epimerase
MKILIVGGTSSLAKALKPVLSEFAEVITAGRKGVCDVYLDLSDEVEKINLPKGIDVVINAAASFGGEKFEDMYQAENVNVLGVLKLCHACSNAQVKHLVLVSSILYTLSKKHSDEIAQLYCSTHGLPLMILRPSQFYGTGEKQHTHQPFFSTIIDHAANNEDILIYGSNDALRNFIHVEDVANIVALVIQHKIEGTYSCMYTENVSYSEIAGAAIKAFGSKSTVKFIKNQADIPNNIFEPDVSLYHLIGYFPQISISLGMQKEAAYRKIVR